VSVHKQNHKGRPRVAFFFHVAIVASAVATLLLGVVVPACVESTSDGAKPNRSSDAGADASASNSRPLPPRDADGPVRGQQEGVITASQFIDGTLATGSTTLSRPAQDNLIALPGGGTGYPVLTSNNPEKFTGTGVLYSNSGRSVTRGTQKTTLSGKFGIYLHHIYANSTPEQMAVSVLMTNPGTAPVTVSIKGSGYTQNETGGLSLGQSPDYKVSSEWITDRPATNVANVVIRPKQGAVLWSKAMSNNREVDARFAVTTSGPVIVYIVAADVPTGSATALQKALDASQTIPMLDSSGDYADSGTPPPPFGREAGVYAYDTWTGKFDVELPSGAKHVAMMVNTATGGKLSQVQAFPALSHCERSAAEAVGMYGNVYDLDIGLRNNAAGAKTRRVRVAFHSLSDDNKLSRFWDGVGLVDGSEVPIQHTPEAPSTVLFDKTLSAGEVKRLRFRAMVPGLASIPQALSVEAF